MNAADRRHYLGGSDAAAVLGLSGWDSLVDLWLDKAKGVRKPVSEAQRRRWKRGHRLEPIIRAMTLDKLADEGHDVELIQCNGRYSDDRHAFLSCEIDFELRVDGEFITADAKSVDGRARDKWGAIGSDEIPIEYMAQFLHGQGIHPLKPRRTLVAALRSWDDVDLYWVTRDDETIAGMREKMVHFWHNHVIPKVPPDPSSFHDVRALFPKAKPKSIEATPEILAAVDRLKKIKIDAATLEREEEDLRFEIARFMGPAALLTNGVRDLISWDNQTTKRFDLEAFKRDHKDWVALYEKKTTGRVLRFAPKRG